MYNFSVRYHDGRLSIAHDATLTLMPDHWLIHYRDPSGELVSARWALHSIVTDENFSNLFIFRYGEFPQQTIECKDDRLPETLKKRYSEKVFFKRRITDIFKLNNTTIVGVALAVLALMGLGYWFGLPWLAGAVASRFPVSTEVQMGDTMYENMIRAYDVDERLTAVTSDFAKAIDFKTHYPIRITVVKNKEVNAFALPGGRIVVFDGILRKMHTKEELAALLAHEVSHVHYRHSLRNIFRSLGGYLFISLLLNDVNGVVTVLADNSNTLANLTYSRELETEADSKGMAIFKANGLDLKGFVDLFTVLKGEHGDVEALKLLSTHPLTEDRLRAAAAMVKGQGAVRDDGDLERKWEVIENELK
ncbi:M48 family metallopeptidase [Dyadobacter jiangsuensis]|uniref:Peptidase M48-like protein n=1 Tax=Dyadobacter jiangsuensis TaxID=1591085 RepID=A0A2P8GFT8_9BACT|nr:M48 family metallopeptidase [Dyadobacter jiangsuensis]PSL32844.1 peptidase M48-like protein [Dyadobacter jiangsuensis]